MLQNDSSVKAEKAHIWELFFLLTLWGWEDQQGEMYMSTVPKCQAVLSDSGNQSQACMPTATSPSH